MNNLETLVKKTILPWLETLELEFNTLYRDVESITMPDLGDLEFELDKINCMKYKLYEYLRNK